MPVAQETADLRDFSQTVTIADSATDSGAVDLAGQVLVGCFLDSGFDGTTLKFKASTTLGGTFSVVNDGAGDLSKTVAASKYVALDPAVFAGIRYLKFTAGTSQTGSTTITVVSRPVG